MPSEREPVSGHQNWTWMGGLLRQESWLKDARDGLRDTFDLEAYQIQLEEYVRIALRALGRQVAAEPPVMRVGPVGILGRHSPAPPLTKAERTQSARVSRIGGSGPLRVSYPAAFGTRASWKPQNSIRFPSGSLK